jgi:hypothetical protein
MARDGAGFPHFDDHWPEIEKLKAQWESLEARIQSGELPAREVQVYVDRVKERLAEWEPHHHPELRRYWKAQGRDDAKRDIAKGALRLFYPVTPPSIVFEGEFPPRRAPLAEFEALLVNRELGVSFVRVNGPRFLGPDWIAVHTRCDGYNEVVVRHLMEKHGFDIASVLWQMAECDAWGPQYPVPDMWEVGLPFAASGASFCLLVGLVVIRRRRERQRLGGFSADTL